MENKKNNKGLIIVLVIIIILLSVFCILLARGVISFNSEKPNNEINDEYNDSGSNLKDGNDNDQNDMIVDEEVLNSLYSIIGILPIDQHYRNDCLNVAISDNNYKENYKSIFSWYANLMSLNTSHYDDAQCQSSEECKIAYSCAACTSITKEDAREILRMYNFNNDISDFLTTLPTYSNEYAYSSYTNHPGFCEFEIKHTTSSKYLNSSDIRIVDNQNVTEYKIADDHSNDNIKSSKKQIVTYDFRKDDDGEYYLYNVNVEE